MARYGAPPAGSPQKTISRPLARTASRSIRSWLGPYKFVSMKPGIELVMEANEEYWRKVPSVKRLVYISVPEATTRLAMLKRGEVDLAYLLEGELGESIKNDAELKLAFSGGIGTHH